MYSNGASENLLLKKRLGETGFGQALFTRTEKNLSKFVVGPIEAGKFVNPKPIFAVQSGWPDWANFRLLGHGLLWAASSKI
jgi:hypothetical protein